MGCVKHVVKLKKEMIELRFEGRRIEGRWLARKRFEGRRLDGRMIRLMKNNWM